MKQASLLDPPPPPQEPATGHRNAQDVEEAASATPIVDTTERDRLSYGRLADFIAGR